MNILAVGAHPDDLEGLMGGTLAKYSKRGDKVYMAVATNGEVGSSTLPKEEIAEIRRNEALESAKVIGAELIWMGFPDEFLFDTEQSRLKFIDVVRQSKPDVVFCHSNNDYHPDHRISGEIVCSIKVMPPVPNIKTDHPPTTKISEIFFMDTVAGINFVPEMYVDITDCFKKKKEMFSKHKSQDSWLRTQYGMTHFDFMEIHTRFRGMQAGVKYAESFSRAVFWPITNTQNLLP